MATAEPAQPATDGTGGAGYEEPFGAAALPRNRVVERRGGRAGAR